MKDFLRLDIKVNFMSTLNWGLPMGIWLQLNNQIPLYLYYFFILLVPLSMELAPLLNKKLTLYSSFKLLLLYENLYVLLFTLLYLFLDVTNVTSIIILLSSKFFGLLLNVFIIKFDNIFNLYYKDKAPLLKSKLQRANFRGNVLGLSLGAITSLYSLKLTIIIFFISEVYSLYLGLKILKLLKTI